MGRNKMVANIFLHTVLMYISYFLYFDNLLLIEQKLINLNSIAKLELVLEVHSNVCINSIDNLSTKTHHLWIIYRYTYVSICEYKQIKCFLLSSHSVTERCNHWRKIYNQPTPPLFFYNARCCNFIMKRQKVFHYVNHYFIVTWF